jgi:hypothetical protein
MKGMISRSEKKLEQKPTAALLTMEIWGQQSSFTIQRG